MNISKDLKELIDANVISTEAADKIDSYYKSKESTSANKLFIVFGVLGALLVGLGVILILAHNWDNLSKIVKTTLAFIPLIIGQLLCLFTLLKPINIEKADIIILIEKPDSQIPPLINLSLSIIIYYCISHRTMLFQ